MIAATLTVIVISCSPIEIAAPVPPEGLGQLLHRLGVADRRPDQDELVGAEPPNHVARLAQMVQLLRHGPDQLVADDRAVDVVDLLEPVEVEQEERRQLVAPPRGVEELGRALDQSLAVEGVGERVVPAQVLRGLARLDLDRDVGGGAAPADWLPALSLVGLPETRSARGRPSRSR